MWSFSWLRVKLQWMSEIFKLSGMSLFKSDLLLANRLCIHLKHILSFCGESETTKDPQKRFRTNPSIKAFQKLWIHISELESAISQQLRVRYTGPPSQIVDCLLKHPWKKFELIWNNFFPFFFWWFLLYKNSRFI